MHWLEYRLGDQKFEEVGFNSASRNGEPFAALIGKKNFLPNSVARFCTQELKIKVLAAFCRSLGWETWTNVIGLRYDEGTRVLKALANNDNGKQAWRSVMPMSKAKATKRDVMAFWAAQPFDLHLKPYEGNCDLCFLKSRRTIQALMRENPGMADWWITQEQKISAGKGGRFVTEYSYLDLADQGSRQGFLFADDGDEFDAECGLTCTAI